MKNNFKAIATKTLLAAAIASAVSGAAFAAEETAAKDQTLTKDWSVVKAPDATSKDSATGSFFTVTKGQTPTVTVTTTKNYGKNAAVTGVEAMFGPDETTKQNVLTIQGGSISGFENSVLNLTGVNVTINDTQFRNNTVAQKGEEDSSVVVVNKDQTVNLNSVVFDGNKAGNTETGEEAIKSHGGAVAVKNGGKLTGDKVVFSNNWARYNGGAVNAYGSVKFNNTVFSNNEANGSGGALVITSDANTFTDTDFDNNKAGAYGGAIRLDNGNATFEITKGKNFAYTGNTTGTTDPASTKYLKHTGGFLYMQGNSKAVFNVAENATLTIGTAGADTDSNASLYEAVAEGTDKAPTITKTGAGDLIVHGDMSGFVGNLTVENGSMVIDGGIGEYDIASQMIANGSQWAPKDSGETTLTIGTETTSASLQVGDLNMNGALAVNVNKGEFTAGNISVGKTTYKSTDPEKKTGTKEVTGDVDFTIAADQTANVESVTLTAGAFGVDTAGAMNVAGNVVVNGGTFTATQKAQSTTGYVAINGDLQVLSGSASIGVDTDATNLVIGKAKVGEEAATKGSVTINGGALAVDKISFATENSTLTFDETNGGVLETSSDQIYSGTGENVKEVTGYNFKNGSLILTDATFDKTKWDDLTAALEKLNGSGIDYYFDTATYVAGEDETITWETLRDMKHLGQAIVTTKNPATSETALFLDQLPAYANDYTLGAFQFAAKDSVTLKNITVGGTNAGAKIIFRGTENGEVFLNSGDATIKLQNVDFGQEDTDHGTITNKVELGTDSAVRNGDFTFGEVVLGQYDLSAQKGATLTVASVDATSTGALDANGGTVKYIGKTNKDGYLDVYGVAQVRQGGTYIAGNHAYAGMEDTSALYIGQKTNFHQGITFGATSETSNEANAIVLDMTSIANSGFDVEKDVVVKVKDDQVGFNSRERAPGTASIHLINKDKRITTSHADRDGFVTYTLNAGKLGTEATVVLENEGDLFGTEYDHTYSKEDGIITVSASKDGAYTKLMESDSAAGYAAAQALKTWDTDQFGLLSLTKDEVAQKLGFENEADDQDVNIVEIGDYILESADEVMLGAVASGAFTAGFDYNYEVAKTLDRRMSIANLNAARNPSGLTPWLDVFGSANEAKSLFSSDGGNYGYEADVYGAVLGFDWVAPCGAIIGAAVNVGTADANSVGDLYTKSDSDSDYYGFSIYGAHRIGNFNGKVDVPGQLQRIARCRHLHVRPRC